MTGVTSCLPVVPSADLERSLKFWREGLGFEVTWYEERREGKLVGCGLGNGRIRVLLNIRDGDPQKPAGYEGVRFYWAPDDLFALHARLRELGYAVSEIEDRYYGQTEFVLTDDDGFNHCFGVPTDDLKASDDGER
jgi:catechol 2,3-dioxygenase-like lactoylglutathione lyase family enzyme